MKELFEYRQKMIQRFGEAVSEFCAACEAVSDPFAKIEDGWNVHQIASHMRDVDKLVYGARIERTLNEDNPEFKNFDADEWEAAHYDPQEPLPRILDEFKSHVDDLCKALAEMPQEGWSREGRHETQGGGLTLQLWVERSLAHIEEHLKTVRQSGSG
jgi:uncharacterized damage-inducible protein DinB